MVLERNELLSIIGGATTKKVGIGIIVAALGSFIIGIIDGYKPQCLHKRL